MFNLYRVQCRFQRTSHKAQMSLLFHLPPLFTNRTGIHGVSMINDYMFISIKGNHQFKTLLLIIIYYLIAYLYFIDIIYFFKTQINILFNTV